ASTLMAVGLILGSIMGVVLAFTLDRLDKTARDRDSIEATLGVDVLASVPNLGFARSLGGALLVMRSEKRSSVILVAQESYRRLRSSLLFLAGAQGLRSVLLTSATPGEGKSVTSANTAIALAESGKRVVLVSADLRRPSLDKLFGLDESEGLGDWLADPEMKRIPMRPVGENLRIVPAGHLPRNPGELMSSARFDSLIKTLASMADIVLVDSPPVLNAADAVGASVYVDGVIVVVDSLRTDTASLNRLRSDIERAGGKLLGAVLNKERRAAITSYGQRYTYETRK
ncbi:MAG: polysaccharide biosynthesis tyrosine autokinase, partial [Acidimicrobiales bacterium]